MSGNLSANWELDRLEEDNNIHKSSTKKGEELKYGICIKSCDCQTWAKTTDFDRRNHRVLGGALVEIFEYNKNYVVLSHFKCKLGTPNQSCFSLILPHLYKYLNAINDNEERLKFYKNNTRREFVLQLKKNTRVSVTVSKNLQIKAVFHEIIEHHKKIFLLVELLEKPADFIVKILKANCAPVTIREFKYLCPANMISKSNSVDAADKIHPSEVDYTENSKNEEIDGVIVNSVELVTEINRELTWKYIKDVLLMGVTITMEILNAVKVRLTARWTESVHPFSSPTYKMDHKYRGIAIIFNNFEFRKGRSLKPRKGTDKDVAALQKCLPLLGFRTDHIFVKQNLKECDVLGYSRTLLESKGDILKDSDCLAIFILSHGSRNNKIEAFDASYNLYDLVKTFTPKNFQPMIAKPKLFFVQACRGHEVDSGETEEDGGLNKINKPKKIILPSYADFLISYASFHDHLSFRDSKMGSWYIQDICKSIEKYSAGPLETTDISEILTYTNNLTTKRTGSDDYENKKQVPSFNSSLSGKLCFKKTTQPVTHKYTLLKLYNIIVAILALCYIVNMAPKFI